MKLTRATSLLLTGLLASGCASTTSEPTATLLQSPTTINTQAYWQLGLTSSDFDALVTNLNAGADINETLYALRGFSYFGNTKNLTTEQLIALDSALFARMQTIAKDDYRTIENYAVTLYRYYYFDDLKDKLLEFVNTGALRNSDTIITNTRHYDSLLKALEEVEKVRYGLETGLSGDLLAIDIRQALYHFGEITGEITNDDLLGNIFANFCIGK